MKRTRTLVYVHDQPSCSRLYKLFNHEFQLSVTYKKEEFLAQASGKDIDVGILCYCFADEKELNSLLEIKKVANHLPLVVCTKIPNPDFISKGAQKGIDHFLLCSMTPDKVSSRIQQVIKEDRLRVFLEDHIKTDTYSPYAQRIITEILHSLPERVKINELANSLGLSSRWIQSLFQQIFGKTYSELMRRLHIYQALNLMKRTPMDNTEIAMELRYSDENSLYRIFHKELGYPPTEARKRLEKKAPEEILG